MRTWLDSQQHRPWQPAGPCFAVASSASSASGIKPDRAALCSMASSERQIGME